MQTKHCSPEIAMSNRAQTNVLSQSLSNEPPTDVQLCIVLPGAAHTSFSLRLKGRDLKNVDADTMFGSMSIFF